MPATLSRLLEAHEQIIGEVREGIARTGANGDAGTNDLLMGDVLRRHEMQVWFVAEHLVDTPVVNITEEAAAGGRTAGESVDDRIERRVSMTEATRDADGEGRID